MKWWFPVLLAAMWFVAGCQAQAKPATQGTTPASSVLDVTAPRTAHQPSVYAIPPSVPRALPAAAMVPAAPSAGPPYLPPGADASSVPPASVPVVVETQATTHAPPASAKGKPNHSAGKTYLVKRGDTLFRIAKEHYGSGGQWRRIAQANPGLTPATLKAGQKLVMP